MNALHTSICNTLHVHFLNSDWSLASGEIICKFSQTLKSNRAAVCVLKKSINFFLVSVSSSYSYCTEIGVLRKGKWKSTQVTKCFSLGNSNVGVGGGMAEEPQRRKISHALKTVVLQICTIQVKTMYALGLLIRIAIQSWKDGTSGKRVGQLKLFITQTQTQVTRPLWPFTGTCNHVHIHPYTHSHIHIIKNKRSLKKKNLIFQTDYFEPPLW